MPTIQQLVRKGRETLVEKGKHVRKRHVFEDKRPMRVIYPSPPKFPFLF